MNSILFCLHRKASLTVCLFLFTTLYSYSQEWTFDSNTQKAYNLAINLQPDEVYELIPDPKTPGELYVVSLAEALELLVTEDASKFSDYEKRLTLRQERRTKLNSAEDLFLQAEIALQWTFVYLKFGHEFDAAQNLRQSYAVTQELKKRFPKFTAIQKTSGLLDVIIGSVPEKYEWILTLLSMKGSVEEGLKELSSIQSSDHVLAFEASLLNALTQAFILQKTDVALVEIKKDLTEQPTNRLALFLGAVISMKNARSEEALAMLNKLEEQPGGQPLYYAEYLKGEVYLHKAEYLNAISSYRSFIGNYKGQNYVKDATYKMGLCYWLNGNASDARIIFKQAKAIGKESAEADKYAARSLADNQLPHIKLTKVRYFTDGGYYEEAQTLLTGITPQALPTKRDQVEFLYRKARVYHKTNQATEAKDFYQRTIAESGEEPWYFAPNACLQLGYLAVAENRTVQAREFFRKALTYKKHEYKNSIDSKAKSALAQLKDSR